MAIETRLQYSISELRELKDQQGYHHQVGLVRLVPNQVLLTARVLGQSRTENLAEIIDYFNGAFYLFKSCVAGFPEKGVPLVESSLKYEWPKPVEFSWVELEKVSLIGKLMRRNVTAGAMVRTSTSELDQVVMNMDKTFPFKIPSLGKVGFVQDGVEWQQQLLKVFNPLSNLSEDLRSGGVQEIEARSRLLLALGQLTKPQQENLQVIKV